MKHTKLIIFAVVVTILISLGTAAAGMWVRECQRPISSWFNKCEWVFPKIKWVSEYYSYLLGFERPTTYMILLQNDMEMRANGGFFGSYVVANVSSGEIDLRFQDIYVPDGQLDGHVEAPKPIEEAFRKGGYLLRDSDWESDFTYSAKTIRWFMTHGGEVDPDVMVTLSLSTIKKILGVTGPIKIPDYELELTQDNIFKLLQAKVESEFFPGSTQKRDILTGVGKSLMAKLEYLSLSQKLEIAEILYSEAEHKNILINTLNSSLQARLTELGLSGALTYPKCTIDNCQVDVFMAVEANLGANKANCCTNRVTKHTITDNGDLIHHKILVEYTNNSSEENPKLPDFFGGNYIDYVRFYIPKEATDLAVSATPTLPTTLDYYPTPYTADTSRLDESDYYLFKTIGLFHITRALTSSKIELSYDLPKTSELYELHILKQHGMQSSPQEIMYGDKVETTELRTDFVFSAN